ncbi:probable N-acetyltransferase 16 isoform X2 [Mercenaria mercenaria]|nr:probable N-acetyltransferase 16 isoform X2 [Mercenaria mercenaria]XP_053405790.1 probable N-acetyltransferase 16 isoform X2 [Mercenaria mercenaria]XP_053405791.1 probable N-acetyltransferase 16 isoform X2 [Mercenaria mercenaria]
MSSGPSSMEIRQAAASDKESVICIHGNVYDGLDYIAEYFDDFLACPLTTPYVAVVQNKIVGFIATFIVDQGKTVITRAGRLSASVGGQGLYKQFQAHVLKMSGTSRHAFTALNTNPAANKETFRAVNKLILSKPLTRFLFDAHVLQSLEESRKKTLNNPSDEDIKHFFSSPAIRKYLFPKERIIVDWVPYRLTEANISLLCWSGKRTKVFSDISVDTDGSVRGLLTFSTIIPVKRPAYNCNFDIYGTDTATLKDHVISHMRYIRVKTIDSTSLLVLVEPDFNIHALEDVFREIGMQRSEWRDSENPDNIYSYQLLFEKEI